MKTNFDISQFVNVDTIQSVNSKLIERVKERRKESGLSQKELANKCGVSYGSIKRFETTGEISFVSLLKIANSLGALSDFNRLFENEIITNLKDYKKWKILKN